MEQTESNIPTTPSQNGLFTPKNLIPLSIFAVILIVLSTLTTYFILKSSMQKEPSNKVISPAQGGISPTTSQDEMQNWKIYINTKSAFKVSYPSDWITKKEMTYGSEVLRQKFETIDRNYSNNATDMYIVVSTEKVNNSILKSIGIVDEGTSQVFSNISGLLYETEGVGDGGSGYRIDFITEKDNKTYWIYLVSNLSNLKDKSIYKNLFNKILSTFTFSN